MKNEIRQDISNIVNEIYGDQQIYSFIPGSFDYVPYAELVGSSDIDLLLVLNAESKNGDVKEMRAKWNESFITLQKDYGLVPDEVFPGEIINTEMLEQTKRGRGFVLQNGQLKYEEIESDDKQWLNNPSLEYRCWRSMFFFSTPDSVLTGDAERYSSDREEVVLPLLLYLNNFKTKGTIAETERRIVQNLVESDVEEFGFKPRYKPRVVQEERLRNINVQNVLAKHKLAENGKLQPREVRKTIQNLKREVHNGYTGYEVNPYIIQGG